LTSSYYRNADAIIVLYDVTDQESFTDVKGHITEGTRYSQRSEKFIVGNKLDLESGRAISKSDGQALADQLAVSGFMETSAKTGENVEDFFALVARKLMESSDASAAPSGGDNSGIIIGEHAPKQKKFCFL
jgi:Ras-related protein Rab-1A